MTIWQKRKREEKTEHVGTLTSVNKGGALVADSGDLNKLWLGDGTS